VLLFRNVLSSLTLLSSLLGYGSKGQPLKCQYLMVLNSWPWRLEWKNWEDYAMNFVYGWIFGWNTKNPADLMMRLFQVDWIEIILCIRNFMTSVIMEMDEDIIVIPLQCQSKVAVVWQVNAGTLAYDKGKYTWLISDVTFEVIPPILQCNGLTGSEDYLAMEVTMAKMTWWCEWQDVIHTLCYCVWLLVMMFEKVFYQLLCGNSLKGYLRFPVMWLSWQIQLVDVSYFFDFWFWFSFLFFFLGHVTLDNIPTTCYHGFVSMRGLTEYYHVNASGWPDMHSGLPAIMSLR